MESRSRSVPAVLFLMALALSLSACRQARQVADEDADAPAPVVKFASGDILISNGGSRAVTLLDQDGNFRSTVYTAGVTENIWGITFIEETNEVAIAIDGVDRVIAVSLEDGSKRDLIININLTGTIKEMTRLISGDLLINETSSVERFTMEGDRISSGGWPKTLQSAPQGLTSMSGGGFVQCSTTADVVGTYTADGTLVIDRGSGIAATTDGVGCVEMSNGNIAAAWSGTNDSVQILNPSLGSVLYTYSNVGVLASPTGLAEGANGNLLVADTVFNYLVEISPTGS